VLEHAVENGVGVDLVRLGRGVAFVRLVEGDVRDVGLPPAGPGDVEVLPSRAARDDDVRGVRGDALGSVGCDGVAEVDISSRQARNDVGATPSGCTRTGR